MENALAVTVQYGRLFLHISNSTFDVGRSMFDVHSFLETGLCVDTIGLDTDMIRHKNGPSERRRSVRVVVPAVKKEAPPFTSRIGVSSRTGPFTHAIFIPSARENSCMTMFRDISNRPIPTLSRSRAKALHGNVCSFRKRDTSCSIYAHRPLECRLLKCWDTRDIEVVYEKDRLTRRDILAGIEGLWELVAGHEKQCGHDVINRALQDSDGVFKKQAQELIANAIQYDRAIRQLVLENGNVTPDMIDFLFGRPLTVTLRSAGIDTDKL